MGTRAPLSAPVAGLLPTVFTVPSGAAFLDSLAAEIARRHGATPLELSAATVLLPNRRACRALAEAFVRRDDGAPTLLPALRPIGDIDESDVALAGTEGEAPAESLELPPAMPPVRRQLLLSRLILTYDSRHRGGGGTPSMDEAQAAHLAAELGRLLDQVETERVSFDGLADLVPERFATHWQGTLDFLKIVTEHWPRILAAEGRIDAAARRNRLIEALARRWRASPLADPVIAAGSTGSIPATAELLDVVCRLPQGALVLPGLDTAMDEAGWEALGPAHPQYGMKELLARIGVSRGEVVPWPGASESPRTALLAAAMRPAAATAAPPAHDAPAAPLDGLGWFEARDSHAEAGFIALVLRETLETRGQTAALITADRALARRVAAELGRWGLEIDDSAGIPLASTPPGTLLGLTATMIAEEISPVSFLAALKHPLVAGGMDRAVFRRLVRRFERVILRGPRPGAGFAGLKRTLDRAAKDRANRPLVDWLDALATAAAPMVEAAARRTTDLGALVRAHLGFVETLAGDGETPGAQFLWAGEAGDEAAAFMGELVAGAAGYPPLAVTSYPALLRVVMRGRVVRRRHSRHPRLQILGPLEGRLQQADLVILGGLNEGTWPAENAVDPWMSRPMRAAFGLPQPERRIGLAAHDFAQAAAAPAVVLTRAEKVDGTPAVPSRWLVRLKAEIGLAGLAEAHGNAARFGHWQWLLDRPPMDSIRACAPPAATPPLAARPRKLSATEIETWMRDPYAIYARRVLNLKALDEIGEEPAARDRGTFIHRALERFVTENPVAPPEDAFERLLQCGREAFHAALDNPTVRAFWWPRFERIARWFVANEIAGRGALARVRAEAAGTLDLAGPEGLFTVTAHADRIEERAAGGIAIVDYKTGVLPIARDVRVGLSPQLPIEAVIAEAGGFPGVGAAAVHDLGYWKLSGASPPGEIRSVAMKDGATAAEARAGLERLIAAFDDRAVPYYAVPRPQFRPRFNDYEHLCRFKEWTTAAEEEDT